MNSRKKITLALVALVLVVAAVAVAITSVLAAQTQNVDSTFTVSYQAGTHVIADVGASYKFTTKQTSAISSFSGTTIGSGQSFASSTSTTTKSLGEVKPTTTYTTTNTSLVIKFDFTNKGPKAIKATLHIQSTDETDFTASTLRAKNLDATYYNGSSWASAYGASVTINGKTLSGNNVSQSVYVQIFVYKTDFNVDSLSFKCLWTLEAQS